MYVQLAAAHAITTGQRNAIFRLLKADMVRNICFHIYYRSHRVVNPAAMKKREIFMTHEEARKIFRLL